MCTNCTEIKQGQRGLTGHRCCSQRRIKVSLGHLSTASTLSSWRRWLELEQDSCTCMTCTLVPQLVSSCSGRNIMVILDLYTSSIQIHRKFLAIHKVKQQLPPQLLAP